VTSFVTSGSAAYFTTSGTAVSFAVTSAPVTFTVSGVGVDGTDGVGVPIGGTAGQVLAKIDSTNYNTEWVDQSGSGAGTADGLPPQAAYDSGRFLTTDGAAASWGTALVPGNSSGIEFYIESPSLSYVQLYDGGVDLYSDNPAGVDAEVWLHGGTVTFSGALFEANGTATQFVPAQTGHAGEFLTTDGTDLSWGASAPGSGLGTVVATGDAAGTTTSGGTINLTLADTAVTPGYYGGQATVGAFGVDSKGRVTYAAGSAISIAPAQVQGTAVIQTLADAKGDIIVASAADTFTRLPVGGTAGHALVIDSTEATGVKWAAVTAGGAILESLIDAKGDLVVGTAADTAARLPVGTVEGHVLTVGTAQPLGIGWAAPAGGGGDFVHIATASPSAQGTINIDNCFTSTYQSYRILIFGTTSAAAYLLMRMRAASTDDSTSNYSEQSSSVSASSASGARRTGQTSCRAGYGNTGTTLVAMDIFDPFAASATHYITNGQYGGATGVQFQSYTGLHNVATSYDGLTIFTDTGTFTGTIRVYGYANS
jgi:hypothetical protein